MEEVRESIMVYSGTYTKDKKFNKNSDYLTYDGNPIGQYKLYLDLETGEAYNIGLDRCIEFETENIVIYMPVAAYSSHEYIKNYMNLQNWFYNEIINRSREEIIEEIKQKYQNKEKVKKYINYNK